MSNLHRSEEKSFPQNKYLLTEIKRKFTQEQPKAHEFQKCEEHGKELNMFCLECNKHICRTCLRTEHKKHEITEIEYQGKEALKKEVTEIKMNLEAKVKIISTTKMDITEKTNAVVADLKKTKEEIDMMIKKIDDQNRIENIRIHDELSAMNSNIELLSSIQQSIEDDEDMSYEGIMSHRDTVVGISEHNTENFSGLRSFGYPVLTKSPTDGTLGKIKTEEISINLLEPERISHENIHKIPTITNASGILICLAQMIFSLWKDPE